MKNENLKTALLNAMEADAQRLAAAAENENPHEFSPEFESAVNRIIRRRKPMRLKAAVISAAAAAAILATTGVAAANGWSLKTAISGLFAEDKNDGSALFGYDINGIGSKELDLTFERDGYKINTVGIVADEYTAYLLYDIVVEEGHIFKAQDDPDGKYTQTYSTEDMFGVYTSFPGDNVDTLYKSDYFKYKDNEEARPRHIGNALDQDTFLISQDANVYHYAVRYDIMPFSFDGKEIEFEFGGPIFNDISYDANCEISDRFTVTFDFLNNTETRLEDVNETFTFNDEEFTFEAVELTPFSVFTLVSQDCGVYPLIEEDDFSYKSKALRDVITVTFKDGTVSNEEMLFKSLTHWGGGGTSDYRHYSTDIHLMWKHPVNVDEIKSITIGDTTFELD